MEHVDRVPVTNRVHDPERVAPEIRDYFYNSSLAEPAQRLGVAVLVAALGNVQGLTHMILDRLGKRPQILQARTDPDHRLQERLVGHPLL